MRKGWLFVLPCNCYALQYSQAYYGTEYTMNGLDARDREEGEKTKHCGKDKTWQRDSGRDVSRAAHSGWQI